MLAARKLLYKASKKDDKAKTVTPRQHHSRRKSTNSVSIPTDFSDFDMDPVGAREGSKTDMMELKRSTSVGGISFRKISVADQEQASRARAQKLSEMYELSDNRHDSLSRQACFSQQKVTTGAQKVLGAPKLCSSLTAKQVQKVISMRRKDRKGNKNGNQTDHMPWSSSPQKGQVDRSYSNASTASATSASTYLSDMPNSNRSLNDGAMSDGLRRSNSTCSLGMHSAAMVDPILLHNGHCLHQVPLTRTMSHPVLQAYRQPPASHYPQHGHGPVPMQRTLSSGSHASDHSLQYGIPIYGPAGHVPQQANSVQIPQIQQQGQQHGQIYQHQQHTHMNPIALHRSKTWSNEGRQAPLQYDQPVVLQQQQGPANSGPVAHQFFLPTHHDPYGTIQSSQ